MICRGIHLRTIVQKLLKKSINSRVSRWQLKIAAITQWPKSHKKTSHFSWEQFSVGLNVCWNESQFPKMLPFTEHSFLKHHCPLMFGKYPGNSKWSQTLGFSSDRPRIYNLLSKYEAIWISITSYRTCGKTEGMHVLIPYFPLFYLTTQTMWDIFNKLWTI